MFEKNLVFLREAKGETQSETAMALGLTRSTYANYETGANEPKADIIFKIVGHFGVSFEKMMSEEITNAHLIEISWFKENSKNAHLIAHANAHLKAKKEVKQYSHDIKISVLGEPENNYGNRVVPITDIRVAAGSGIYNPEYVENVGTWGIPPHLLKKNGNYLAVRIKGDSMAPTLQDDSYMIVRLLDRSEWSNVSKKGERIYVVTDQDGKAYLKRIKNRLQQGFIVLMSDNPDKASNPNFNLKIDEIQTIWEAEWYFSAKMPNIHDQYYTKLQNLENRVEDLVNLESKVNQLIKRLGN